MRLRVPISIAAVLVILVATLPAQRGRVGRGTPRARPPAGKGHSTASGRLRARSVSEKGERKRTDVNVPWIERTGAPPAPRSPSDPDATPPKRDPELVKKERALLVDLEKRYSRLKSLTYRAYLSVKPKGKSSRRVNVDYFGRYDRERRQGFHRLTIQSRPPRRIIIHETFGGKSKGWVISDDTQALDAPLRTPLLPGSPAIVLDALPIELDRYNLGLEGEGRHKGSAVWYLVGERKDGSAIARVTVRKSVLLPVQAQVFTGDKLVREISYSRLKMIGGILTFSQRRVRNPASGESIDFVCRDWRINAPVPESLFAPPE